MNISNANLGTHLFTFICVLGMQSTTHDSSGWTSSIGQLISRPDSPMEDVMEIKPSVCNIEGDRPGFHALMMNSKTLWGNVVFTLDAPFSMHSQVHYTFQELLDEQKKHGYKCLEASIPNFDQQKVLITQLFWISYYIELCSQNRSEGQDPLITVQVHQLPSETDQLNLFMRYLPHLYETFQCLENEEMYKTVVIAEKVGNVRLHFKYGYDVDADLTRPTYQTSEVPAPNSDAYLSFSMSIGYDPAIGPSDAIYPNTFYCLDPNTKILWNYPSYREHSEIKVNNDFITQFKTVRFEEKKADIIKKWVEIIKYKEPFYPEGKGVIVHDNVDTELLIQNREGAVAKIVGLWSPDPQSEHPIKFWNPLQFFRISE